MSKKQQLNKFKAKQKQSKLKEIPSEKRIDNLIASLEQSPDATSALKKALLKTLKG